MSARIRIGTASWSDPGFVHDWYPQGLPRNQLLVWYAQRFDFVEVNSTFYSIPTERMVETWCRQTPDDFLFDVKVFKLLSRHATEAKFLPPDFRPNETDSGKVTLNADLERKVAERFLREVQPLRRAGKLGAFLLQLSPAFRPKNNDLAELQQVIDIFAGEKLAVELRNRDWLTGEQQTRTVEFFAKNKLSLVTVDAPESEHFTILPFVDTVTNPALAYWRFHGRNEAAFITGRTVAERFDYQYSTKELQEIAQKLEAVAPKAEELHLVFNNNRSNYAPKAAAELMEIVQKNRSLASGLLTRVPSRRPLEQTTLDL